MDLIVDSHTAIYEYHLDLRDITILTGKHNLCLWLSADSKDWCNLDQVGQVQLVSVAFGYRIVFTLNRFLRN